MFIKKRRLQELTLQIAALTRRVEFLEDGFAPATFKWGAVNLQKLTRIVEDLDSKIKAPAATDASID